MLSAHQSVLLKETIDLLDPQSNENFIDCTLGGAGHAQAILSKTSPKGKLLGIDWDAQAIARSRESLKYFSKRVILLEDNYQNLKDLVSETKFSPINGILFDLGFSSDQIQQSGRGFSWKVNEDLDMRYAPSKNKLTAKEIVNSYSEKELFQIFKNFGEERYSGRIAKSIIKRRKQSPIEKTQELALIIYNTVPKKFSRIHPATRVFQALRIEVNQEFENIEKAVQDAIDLLESGGRLAVISFHSLEHRIIKNIFKENSKKCICPPEQPQCTCQPASSKNKNGAAKIKIKTKKAVRPTEEEVKNNPRSRSAQLRVAQKI